MPVCPCALRISGQKKIIHLKEAKIYTSSRSIKNNTAPKHDSVKLGITRTVTNRRGVRMDAEWGKQPSFIEVAMAAWSDVICVESCTYASQVSSWNFT